MIIITTSVYGNFNGIYSPFLDKQQQTDDLAGGATTSQIMLLTGSHVNQFIASRIKRDNSLRVGLMMHDHTIRDGRELIVY